MDKEGKTENTATKTNSELVKSFRLTEEYLWDLCYCCGKQIDT